MDMESARRFIYRHARPLDFARWRVHFEGGSRADVLAALAAYQNADGGFGHGLEADCLNPNSTPVQTWAATQILYEVGVTDAAHPMVAGILRYLDSTPLFDGHTWAGLTGVRSNDDYPHAPWWSYAPEDAPTYNPTASLAGFILRFAPKDSTIYQTGWRVACEAVTWLTRNAPIESMHTAACFVSLHDSLAACGAHSRRVKRAVLWGKAQDEARQTRRRVVVRQLLRRVAPPRRVRVIVVAAHARQPGPPVPVEVRRRFEVAQDAPHERMLRVLHANLAEDLCRRPSL